MRKSRQIYQDPWFRLDNVNFGDKFMYWDIVSTNKRYDFWWISAYIFIVRN